MGTDYLMVHIKYTIPPALLLTLLYRPLHTLTDTYKLGLLLFIAILSTIPWDSYLISRSIWTYPHHAILGPALLGIPVEEVFFFFIQTYTTTLIYLVINKPTVHVAYLTELSAESRRRNGRKLAVGGLIGGMALLVVIYQSYLWVHEGKEGTYIGLLGIWAAPVLLLLWCLSYKHILSLPTGCVLYPALLPTMYLWMVDTWELRRGTWAIAPGTKLGIQLWPGMEIEEAVFFLTTNTLITLGLVTFDYALALVTAFPAIYPLASPTASLFPLLKAGFHALTTTIAPFHPGTSYASPYTHLPQTLPLLRQKSRSFYLASAMFTDRLRLDLINLYSFCRAADDLIDESPSPEESLARLKTLLEIMYAPKPSGTERRTEQFVLSMFPRWAHAPLLAVPKGYIPRSLLEELLEGFEIDMKFDKEKGVFPIETTAHLRRYAHCVAGTVGAMFTLLVLAHYPAKQTAKDKLLAPAATMGHALQFVNIARDISKDAALGRCYIPTSWLTDSNLTPSDIVKNPCVGEELFRERLLRMAEELYGECRGAVELLPLQARGGGRVAVEGYMDIGRRLRGGEVGRKSRWLGERKLVRVARAWWVMGGWGRGL